MQPYRDGGGRLDAIHSLRGAAALSVCLLHVSVATFYTFPPSVVAVARLGDFGVPVFFVISGFVVPFSLLGRGYTIRAFPRFVLRRITRLDPPYFVALALALALAFSRSLRGTPFPFSNADMLLHVGYLSGLAGRPWILSTFWTLGIEFQYYLLIGLALAALLPLARRLTTPALAGPLLIGMLCAAFFLLDETGRWLGMWLGDSRLSATWVIYKNDFLLGMAALIVWRMRLPLAALIGVALLMFGWDHMLSWWTQHTAPNWPLTREWLVLTGIAVVIVRTPSQWRWLDSVIGRRIAALGTISYSLYVTHALVVGLLLSRLLAAGRMPGSAIGIWLIIVAELAICLGFSSVFYVLVERPAWRWSKRLSLTRAAAPTTPRETARGEAES
jgi:peptidoglycan/LPS O-acetylase OafA/YrhL